MPPSPPDWLPATLPVNGDWDAVLRRLHDVFLRDLSDLRFRGCPVWWDTRRETPDDHDEGFWHIITKGERPEDRLFDPPRAAKLSWLRPIVDHCDDPAVKAWDYIHPRGKMRTYLWLEAWDYVVILEFTDRFDDGPVYMLVTAHHIDHNSKRRDLQKRYEKRI